MATDLSFLRPKIPTTRDLVEPRKPFEPNPPRTNIPSDSKVLDRENTTSRPSSGTPIRRSRTSSSSSASTPNLSVAPEFGGGTATVKQSTPTTEPQVSDVQSTEPNQSFTRSTKTSSERIQDSQKVEVLRSQVREDIIKANRQDNIRSASDPNFLTKVRFQRAKAESQGTFSGNVVSGGLAFVEVGGEIVEGVKSVGGAVGRDVQNFEVSSKRVDAPIRGLRFPIVRPKQGASFETAQIPKGVGQGLREFGPSLERDPLKGGAVIVSEVATSFIPISLIKRADKSVGVPSGVQAVSPDRLGSGFTPIVSSSDFLIVKTKKEIFVGSSGVSQLDLSGRPASTSFNFRAGDFIPVGVDPVTNKIKWLAPDSPELKRSVTSPFGSGQTKLTSPSIGVSDPVIIRDIVSNKVSTVEASSLVDLFSDAGGRFKVVGRPTSSDGGFRISSSGNVVQKSLADDKGSFLFSFPIPVPLSVFKRSPSSLFDDVPLSSAEFRGFSSVDASPSLSTLDFSPSPTVSASSVSSRSGSSFRLTGLTSTSVSLNLDSQVVSPSAFDSGGFTSSFLRSGSDSLSGTKSVSTQNLSTVNAPLLSSFVNLSGFTAVSNIINSSSVSRPKNRLGGLPVPKINFPEFGSSSGFKGFSGRFTKFKPSVRTAQAGKKFLTSFRKGKGVTFVKEGKRIEIIK